MIARNGVPAMLPELRAVSDAWLAAKNTAEKPFPGFFEERYKIAHFDNWRVRHRGSVVAFANLLRGGFEIELSVISCATTTALPKGVMDFG